jgi:hypothetical protein
MFWGQHKRYICNLRKENIPDYTSQYISQSIFYTHDTEMEGKLPYSIQLKYYYVKHITLKEDC